MYILSSDLNKSLKQNLILSHHILYNEGQSSDVAGHISSKLSNSEVFFTNGFPLGFDEAEQETEQQELIILNLISMDKSNFDMNQVLTLLKNLDAKYVQGFFSFRDMHGQEIFRIASGINPGLLEAETKTHVLLLVLDQNCFQLFSDLPLFYFWVIWWAPFYI